MPDYFEWAQGVANQMRNSLSAEPVEVRQPDDVLYIPATVATFCDGRMVSRDGFAQLDLSIDFGDFIFDVEDWGVKLPVMGLRIIRLNYGEVWEVVHREGRPYRPHDLYRREWRVFAEKRERDLL